MLPHFLHNPILYRYGVVWMALVSLRSPPDQSTIKSCFGQCNTWTQSSVCICTMSMCVFFSSRPHISVSLPCFAGFFLCLLINNQSIIIIIIIEMIPFVELAWHVITPFHLAQVMPWTATLAGTPWLSSLWTMFPGEPSTAISFQ